MSVAAPPFPDDLLVLRAQLKHHWLENQVLNKSSADIAFLRESGDWEALHVQFPVRLQEAERLGNRLEDLANPATLIDRIATFEELPSVTRQAMREAVSAAYLKHTNIQELKLPFQDAVERVRRAVLEFIGLWSAPEAQIDSAEITRSWQLVVYEAQAFHAILEQLPRDTVLP